MSTPTTPATRREHDFLGAKEITADAYWGVHTARAVKAALATGGTIAEAAEALGIMTRDEMRALLVPQTLTAPVHLKA